MDVGGNVKIQKSQSIDWKLCIKLANNKEDLANEMLTMFMAELPTTKKMIQKAHNDKNYDLLHQHIHKLHGATCYCGLPKLKELVAGTETALKTKQLKNLDTNIKAIFAELKNIEQEYAADEFRS